MLRRLLSLVLVLGLLVPALTGVVAAKGGNGKSNGVTVQSASYDAGTGELTTTVRWNKRELKKDGRDALHVVAYHDGDEPQVLADQTVTATPRNHARTHRITLSPEQRETAGDGRHLVVVVTHKHDDDGGHFDRVWHHRLPVNATTRDAAADCSLIAPYADLSGCDLSGASLSLANLTGANLTGADLYGTDLTYANLTDANLTGVDLSYAIGSFANLSRAILKDAEFGGAKMDGATLSWADLTDAHLSYSKLDHANLSHANLTGADASFANLPYVKLSYANLTDANLYDSTLSFADLTSAILSHANLYGARMDNVKQDNAVFCGTTMPDGKINNTGCSG